MSEPEQQPRTADDLGHFFKSLLKNPLSIGAVAPSGRFLARLMATTLEPGARVIELGAGTGTVTQAILDAGVEPKDLYLVEQDARFVCSTLRSASRMMSSRPQSTSMSIAEMVSPERVP